MREQYKVLAEKYSLITEGHPPLNNGIPWWHLEKTDYWYNYISLFRVSGQPVGQEIIDWFNNYGLRWAFGYEAYEKDVVNDKVEDLVGVGFLDWLRDAIIEDLEKKDYSPDFYKNNWHRPHLREEIKQLEEEAEQKVVDALYHDGLKPWLAEQERLRVAALNKDNPGIEMDI